MLGKEPENQTLLRIMLRGFLPWVVSKSRGGANRPDTEPELSRESRTNNWISEIRSRTFSYMKHAKLQCFPTTSVSPRP